jgi:hypothetical protein
VSPGQDTLCVVPCGSKKIWDKLPDAGPSAAKEVYTGPLAAKCREYAEKFHPGAWCILSAKHGFLLPDEKVPGPYNATFNDKKTNPVGIEELRLQAVDKGLDNFKCFVALGGKNYVDIVSRVFSPRPVANPLRECRGIGFMMALLTEAVTDNRKL